MRRCPKVVSLFAKSSQLLARFSSSKIFQKPCRIPVTPLGPTCRYSSASLARPSAPEYDWIDGVEQLAGYSPGGYHPVSIGDVLHERYHIMHKLGFGGWYTVWLARDTRLEQYVALKVCTADSLQNETKIHRGLSTPLESFSPSHPGRDLVPMLLDEFQVEGPNGTHICFTTPLARCNLWEISYSRLFTLEVARALSAGLTLALAYTHSRGYVHGDIHLRNVLLALPPSFHNLSIPEFYEKYGKPETVPITRSDGESLPPNAPAQAVLPLCLQVKVAKDLSLSEARVILSDFGAAYSPASELRQGKDCHTPLYVRPPEARFDPHAALLQPADVWSLAAAIWEILGMKAVFNAEWATQDDLTAQHVDALGPLPPRWWDSWQARSEYFHEDGSPTQGRWIKPRLDQTFEDAVQKYRKEDGMGEFGDAEKTAILELMQAMFAFRPEDRPSVEDVLKSKWMVEWALPDLRRVPGAPPV